jgi:hypothetical protein
MEKRRKQYEEFLKNQRLEEKQRKEEIARAEALNRQKTALSASTSTIFSSPKEKPSNPYQLHPDNVQKLVDQYGLTTEEASTDQLTPTQKVLLSLMQKEDSSLTIEHIKKLYTPAIEEWLKNHNYTLIYYTLLPYIQTDCECTLKDAITQLAKLTIDGIKRIEDFAAEFNPTQKSSNSNG